MFSKNNYISAMGLMSGTSMDGIDGAIIVSDGLNILKNQSTNVTQYSNSTSKLLFKAFNNISIFLKNEEAQKELQYKVTLDHAKASKNLINKSNIIPKIIGFHGQTIFHNPKTRQTIQLGDGKLLSKLLKIDVISNFRDNDILNGGEGAPLAPIYHKLLIQNYNLALPSCIINIGGISNITYYDGQELIAFDIGPGNGLMDSFMQKKLNKKFDENGLLASKGIPNEVLVKEFFNEPFFSKNYPKSLDRNDFKQITISLNSQDLSYENSMATLAELTIGSIVMSLKILPQKPQSIIIVGGGANNKNLMNRLKNLFGKIICVSDDIGLSSISVEAELMAYLAIRSLYKLPITFPKTTGVKTPIVGGILYKYS